MIGLLLQGDEWEVLEIVRSIKDVLASHQQVIRLNFIPRRYILPSILQDSWAQVESQEDAGGAVENETQPLSLVSEIEYHTSNEKDN